MFCRLSSVFLALLMSRILLAGPSPEEVTIEGTIVCLSADGRTATPTPDCQPPAYYGLRTDSGVVYSFLQTDVRSQILKDSRVRSQTLRIVGWLKEGGGIEITKLQALKNGRLYDVFYHCDTCDITTHVPGACPCCGAEMQLRETPAEGP